MMASGAAGRLPGPQAQPQAVTVAVSSQAASTSHVGTRAEHLPLRRLARTAGVQVTRAHPHMLRHTFVTTMLDAGVDLRDVQIAARHAGPRTTMRSDRARTKLDRHPNYILAAYTASGT
jgi:integrase/recombinase XerD